MTELAPSRERDGRKAAFLAGLVILVVGLGVIDSLPVGVALDVAGGRPMLLPPMRGIVPDEFALDA